MARPVRVTAMHERHVTLGATFREDGDWRVADVYRTPVDEVQGALAGLGLADTSAGGKLQVRGERVDELLVMCMGPEPLASGMAVRSRLNGAQVLACRVAPDELLVLTGARETPAVTKALEKAAAGVGCAHVTDLTSGLAAIDLLGPNVPRLLAAVVPLDLSPMGILPLAIVHGEVARARAILIRLDRPRVPAFRALVAREHGAFVWDALLHVGRPLGVVPVGSAARAALDEGPRVHGPTAPPHGSSPGEA